MVGDTASKCNHLLRVANPDRRLDATARIVFVWMNRSFKDLYLLTHSLIRTSSRVRYSLRSFAHLSGECSQPSPYGSLERGLT